jgi:hypothetical protein
MLFDVTINSIDELLTALGRKLDGDDTVWFRGQSNSAWKLIPTIARKKKTMTAEAALFKRFQQNAIPFLDH